MNTETPRLSLSDKQVASMRLTLSRHFGMPVAPISEYCAALETWARAIGQRATDLRALLYPGIDYVGDDEAEKRKAEEILEVYKAERDAGDRIKTIYETGGKPTDRDHAVAMLREHEKLSDEVSNVFLQIRKSNLLARLIYGGQQLRTRPCPVHKGKWSGCAWEKLSCGCLDGCNVTGWLPNEGDAAAKTPAPGGPIPVTVFSDGAVDLAPSMKSEEPQGSWCVADKKGRPIPELRGLTEDRAWGVAHLISNYEGQFKAIDESKEAPETVATLGSDDPARAPESPSAPLQGGPSAPLQGDTNLASPPKQEEAQAMTQPTDPVHAHPAQPAAPAHQASAAVPVENRAPVKKVFVSGEEKTRPKPMRRIEAFESPTTTRAFSTEPQVSPETSRAEDVPATATPAGPTGPEAAAAPDAKGANGPAGPAPAAPEGQASAAAAAPAPSAPKQRLVFHSKTHDRVGEVPQPIGKPTPAVQSGGSPLHGARPMQNQSIIRDAKPSNRELNLRYDAEGVEPNGLRAIERMPGVDLSLTRVLVPDSMAPNGQSLYRIESVTVEGREAMRPEFREKGGVPTKDLVDASADVSNKFFDLGVVHSGKPVTLTVRRLSETPIPFLGGVMGTRYVAPAAPAPEASPAPAAPPAVTPPAPVPAPAPDAGAAPVPPTATEPV